MNNNFFMDYTITRSGKHTVTLADWLYVAEVRNMVEEIDENGNNRSHLIYPGRPADEVISKAHLLLTLKGADGEVMESKLYPGRLAYFMSCIVRQTEGAVMGMQTSQVLEYLRKHSFDVWVSYSTQYGVQFDYREPRN